MTWPRLCVIALLTVAAGAAPASGREPDWRITTHSLVGAVLAVVQVAMLAGLPYTALRDAVLTHPTMAEGLAVLFSSVPRG